MKFERTPKENFALFKERKVEQARAILNGCLDKHNWNHESNSTSRIGTERVYSLDESTTYDNNTTVGGASQVPAFLKQKTYSKW